MRFLAYLYGFDTEAIRKGDEYVFFSFQVADKWTSLISYDIKDLVNIHKLLNIPYRKHKPTLYFVCHNLDFDFGIIVKALSETGIDFNFKVRYNKSQMISASLYLKNERRPLIRFIGLENYVGRIPLSEVAKQFGLEKLPKPKFLGIREPRTKKEKEYFERYAINDAKICYHVFRRIYDQALIYNPNLKLNAPESTMPALALRLFTSKVKIPQYEHRFDKIIEKSYRGGRCEAIWRGKITDELFGTIYVYDFNSLYPYVMMTSTFPNTEDYTRGLDLEREGFALVTVKVDEDIITPLGVKREVLDCGRKTEKLIFPSGKFKDIFTFSELRYLEDKGFGKILKVHVAYNFEPIDSPFREFIEFWYRVRKEKPEFKFVAKLLMNSLYGKFGTRFYNVYVRPLWSFEKLEEMVGWTPNWNLNIVRKVVKSEKMPFVGINPLWASYITANARLVLFDKMHEIIRKGHNVFYCDTDSIFTDYKMMSSDEIGKLKLEFECSEVTIFRSKFYFIRPVDGELIRKVKGIPNGANFEIKNDVAEFSFERVVKLRESLQRKKKPLEVEKALRRIRLGSDGKRIYRKEDINPIKENTDSIPLHLRL